MWNIVDTHWLFCLFTHFGYASFWLKKKFNITFSRSDTESVGDLFLFHPLKQKNRKPNQLRGGEVRMALGQRGMETIKSQNIGRTVY